MAEPFDKSTPFTIPGLSPPGDTANTVARVSDIGIEVLVAGEALQVAAVGIEVVVSGTSHGTPPAEPLFFPGAAPGLFGARFLPTYGTTQPRWDAAISESASAADAVRAGLLSWSASLTEAATAADAYSQVLSWSESLTEATSATDAVSAADLSWSASLTEAAIASDVYSQVLSWSADLIETVTAADTASADISWSASLIEATTAADAYSQTLTWDAAISETATAADSLDGSSPGTGSDQVAKIVGAAWRGSLDTRNEVGKIVGAAWRGSLDTRNEVGKIVGAALIKRRPPDLGFDPLFPPNISYGAVGGCGWQTRIAVTTSGEEYRSNSWARSLGRWTVSHNLRTPAQWKELQAFHRIFQGRYGAFRFKDWTDFQVQEGEGVLLPTTDFLGRPVLAKRYTFTDLFGAVHYVDRPITKPKRFTVVFSTPDIDLDYSRGLAFGGIVGTTTWTGEFENPARFDVDIPEIARLKPTAAGWRGILLAEVRSELGMDDPCPPAAGANTNPFG